METLHASCTKTMVRSPPHGRPMIADAPSARKLTIVAKDPGLRLGGPDGPMAFTQVSVPAELLAKGPTGYRIKVVDYNATERTAYFDNQDYQLPEETLVD